MRNVVSRTALFALLGMLVPCTALAAINVGNFVWADRNGNGIQDAGESGIPNVNVQLWNASKTNLIDVAMTNANGNYTLVAPGPGDYRVRVVLPSPDHAFSPKNATNDLLDSDVNPSGTNAGFTDTYTFPAGLVSTSVIDAGIIPPPPPKNVGNFVWHDVNENGIQDAGEPGIAGVTVQLWNAAKTNLIDSTTTNTNGNYTLVAPTSGTYRVRFLLPLAGDAFTTKNAGASDMQDSDANPSGVNFGFTDIYTFQDNLVSITSIDAGIVRDAPPPPPPPKVIGDFVWHDVNEDGVQNAGEPGIPDVTVQLWNAAKTQLIDSTTTTSTGAYTLAAPMSGDYRVRVLLPAGYPLFTTKHAGGNDELDSDINPSGTDFGFTDVITLDDAVTSVASVDAGLVAIDAETPPEIPTATVVEYYHAGFDHHFITANPAEIAQLDGGAFSGWVRTGNTFNVVPADADVPNTTPVCRFYIPPALGDSHFYSASPTECEQVRTQFPTFVYESANVFRVFLPDTTTGDCPAGTIPVHRSWNQRADSNHRYTISLPVLNDMVVRGHVAEGYGNPPVAMCTVP